MQMLMLALRALMKANVGESGYLCPLVWLEISNLCVNGVRRHARRRPRAQESSSQFIESVHRVFPQESYSREWTLGLAAFRAASDATYGELS